MTRTTATGDWTTFDLVKYLVFIQSTLAVPEVRLLSQTPAFPKEGVGKEQSVPGISPKIRRYRAKDLYEPIDIFRELGLPIIDWGSNDVWRPESDEGKLL